MKDGAVLANAGHFDVEIDLAGAARAAARRARARCCPLVEQYDLGDGRRLNLLAARARRQPRRRRGPPGRGDGHVVRHPGARRRAPRARAARRSAPGVHPVPDGDRPRGRARSSSPSLGVEIDELHRRAARATCARWRAGHAPRDERGRPAASVEKMRARGRRRRPRSTPSRTTTSSSRRARRGCSPRPTSSPSRDVPDADDLPDAATRRSTRRSSSSSTAASARHGHDARQVAARGQGRARRSSTSSPARCSTLRERTGARLPLVLMNRFRTRDDSLARARALRRTWRPTCRSTSSRTRCPSCAPTTSRRSSGRPTRRSSGARPATATSTPRCSRRACSTTLLERGYRYAFVSNSDNLGAVLEPRILAWFAREGLPVRDGGRRPHARPTARAATSRGCRTTAGWCCARPRRRPTRTSTRSRTSPATATSTPTTCGSTCARSTRCCASATACSGCR